MNSISSLQQIGLHLGALVREIVHLHPHFSFHYHGIARAIGLE